MSKTAEPANKYRMGAEVAEPLSWKPEPAITLFKKVEKRSSERVLEQSEAILFFRRNARKTDCVLTLGCATPLPTAPPSCALLAGPLPHSLTFNINIISVKQELM